MSTTVTPICAHVINVTRDAGATPRWTAVHLVRAAAMHATGARLLWAFWGCIQPKGGRK